MSVEQLVRDAVERGQHGVALLVLAREVDRLMENAAGHEDWSMPSTDLEDPPTDPDDRRAWEAQRRLRADARATTPDIGVLQSKYVTVDTGAGLEITVPETPQHIQLQRAAQSPLDWTNAEWSSPALDKDTARAAYIKGGPLWLYAYDRSLVMRLPESAQKSMVQDVMEYAPDDAHEFARDILKRADPGEVPAW